MLSMAFVVCYGIHVGTAFGQRVTWASFTVHSFHHFLRHSSQAFEYHLH